MKSLVAYLSRSGKTRMVADAIFEEIPGDKEIKQLREVSDLKGYDLSFIGFPIERFGPATEAAEFLRTHSDGHRVALFVTHAAPEDSDQAATYVARSRELVKEADLAGIFNCQGEMALPVKQALLSLGDPTLAAFANGDNSAGQPNARRLDLARAFAREVVATATSRESEVTRSSAASV
ncbi:MAG TPA: flavodoxin family protein [Chloroflexota bacterium]|nr:flavodoxin family protein [Chloroflexota bacterium]